MAYALEARSPLLDHEFMELAASIPPQYKASGVQRKIALKGALREWLPEEVLDGPKKGFELPVTRWLRTDLAPFAREILLDGQSIDSGWIRAEEVATLIDEHVGGTADHGRRLWSLLTLELWAQSEDAAGSGLVPPSPECPERTPPAGHVDRSMRDACLIDPIADPEWLELVENSPTSEVFHHPSWLELLRSQYGYGFEACCIGNGRGIEAGIPIARIDSRLTGSRLVSLPFSDVCSPALADDADPAAPGAPRRSPGRGEHAARLGLTVHAPLPERRGSGRPAPLLSPPSAARRRSGRGRARLLEVPGEAVESRRHNRRGSVSGAAPTRPHSTPSTRCTWRRAAGRACRPSLETLHPALRRSLR